jgi:hypothetical protein
MNFTLMTKVKKGRAEFEAGLNKGEVLAIL